MRTLLMLVEQYAEERVSQAFHEHCGEDGDVEDCCDGTAEDHDNAAEEIKLEIRSRFDPDGPSCPHGAAERNDACRRGICNVKATGPAKMIETEAETFKRQLDQVAAEAFNEGAALVRNEARAKGLRADELEDLKEDLERAKNEIEYLQQNGNADQAICMGPLETILRALNLVVRGLP